MVRVWPVRLMVVPESLHSSGAVALVVPPTVVGSTLTVLGLELAAAQTPLCTTARNWVVLVKGPVLNGLAVEVMSAQVLPSVEDCRSVVAPVWPVKLMVVPEPLHSSGAVALVVPATVVGSTLTVLGLELAAAHTPLCTTARNWVVLVKGPVLKGLAVEVMSAQVLPSVEDC